MHNFIVLTLILTFNVATFAAETAATGKPAEASKARKKKDKREPAEESLIENDEDFQVTTHKTDGSEDFSDSKDRLNIVSWKMKKGGFKYDVDRVANVLSSADITVLQDIEFNENGETSVNVIANILEKRLNEKICRGWFKNANGKRNRFGFIWRDVQLSYVEKNGEVRESCSTRPIVIRAETKDYGVATFYLKSNRRLFVLTSVDLEKVKNADREIPRLFRAHSESDWAVVYAGDNKTSAKSAAFKDVRKWNFKPALNGAEPKSTKKNAKKTLDNIWYKNISLIAAEKVNLYEQFPELNAADVDNAVGDNFPLRAEFTFSEHEAEAVQTQMISKKKRKKVLLRRERRLSLKVPSYPAPVAPHQLSSLKEDIESEAQSTDPDRETSTKTASKSSKKKKKK